MPGKTELTKEQEQLADLMVEFYADPLGFVLFAFPWGERGALEEHDGPDEWQRQFLTDLGNHVKERKFNGADPVMPVRMAVSSGHGIGKGVLAAMIHWWIMSTRPHSQGTVTANSFPQLETKTWAKIRSWGKLCITSDWFNIGSDMVRHKVYPASWFSSAQSCREENSESFAGQHAASATSFYMFDEASAIPPVIFEVAAGGLTDGEPMVFMFGNPTRNYGEFHKACFGSGRNLWDVRCIDSRNCRFSNKQYIEEVISESAAFGGEDSDRVRVRVRGLPPRAADTQFIGTDTISGAQHRQVTVLPDEPLIMGIDLARGGSDNNVIRYRRGMDARTIPAVIIPGEKARDSMWMVTKIAAELNEKKPEMCFLDATGGSIGGPIGDRLRQLGYRNVIDVQFGGEPPDAHCANMRAYMWKRLKEALPKMAIDKSPRLEIDLSAPEYHADRRDRLVLESKEDMKKRDLASPDEGDALALTFAQPVAIKRKLYEERSAPVSAWS